MSRGFKKYPLEAARISHSNGETKVQFNYRGMNHTIRFNDTDFENTKQTGHLITAKVLELEPARESTSEDDVW